MDIKIVVLTTFLYIGSVQCLPQKWLLANYRSILYGNVTEIMNSTYPPARTNIYFRGPFSYDTVFSKLYSIEYEYIYKTDISKNRYYSSFRLYGSQLSALAVDWVNRNLYYTELYSSQIYVSTLRTSILWNKYKMLINDVCASGGIAVDPINRFIFFGHKMPGSSFGSLEQSDLDGNSRKRVLYLSIKIISDIALRIQDKLIYWTDKERFSIERCSYSGDDRNVIYREETPYAFFLAVDQTHICSIFNYGELTCFDNKFTQMQYKDRYLQPGPLAWYDKTLQPRATSPCRSDTCSHICVPSGNFSKCLCPEGLILLSDNKTCNDSMTLERRGLLLGNSTHTCKYDVRITVETYYARYMYDCFLNNLFYNGLGLLTADPVNDYIYRHDKYRKEIVALSIASETLKTVTRTSEHVSGLTFDWIKNTIYWSESDTGGIFSIIVNEQQRSLPITKRIQQPWFVTIDVVQQLLFWKEGAFGFKSKLLLMQLENKQEKVVLDSDSLSYLNGISLDYMNRRIYFVSNKNLYGISYSGQILHTIYDSYGYTSLPVIFNKNIIWLSRNNSIINFAAKTQTRSRNGFYIPINNISGMAVFDKADVVDFQNPCLINNGGCDQICLKDTAAVRCACEVGFKLLSKGKCMSDLKTSEFLLTLDKINKRIYQIPLEDPNNINAISITLSSPSGLSYVPNTKKILWYDSSNSSIFRINLNGTQQENIFSKGIFTFQDMTVDPSNGHIYLVFSLNGNWTVGVLNPDTKFIKTLFVHESKINRIRAFPKIGILVFSSGSSIFQSSMDGTNLRPFSLFNVPAQIEINAISVDYKRNCIYFSSNISIYSLNIETDTTAEILQEKADEIVHSNNYIYFYSRHTSKIRRINATDYTEDNSWMNDIPELGTLQFLTDSNNLSSGHSICSDNNGGCVDLCLPTGPDSFICACPDGYIENGTGCHGIKSCPPIFDGDRSFYNNCRKILGETCYAKCGNNGHLQSWICSHKEKWIALNSCDDKAPSLPISQTYTTAGIGSALGFFAIVIFVLIAYIFQRKKRTRPENNLSVSYNPQNSHVNAGYQPNTVRNRPPPPLPKDENSGAKKNMETKQCHAESNDYETLRQSTLMKKTKK